MFLNSLNYLKIIKVTKSKANNLASKKHKFIFVTVSEHDHSMNMPFSKPSENLFANYINLIIPQEDNQIIESADELGKDTSCATVASRTKNVGFFICLSGSGYNSTVEISSLNQRAQRTS